MRELELFAAPNCETEGLGYQPTITTDERGRQWLHVFDDQGEAADSPKLVEDAMYLPLSDLMLARTDGAVYLLRDDDFEAGIPRKSAQQLAQENAGDYLDDLLNGMIHAMRSVTLDATTQAVWDAGVQLTSEGGRYRPAERLGQLLCLDAMIAAPKGTQQALLAMRAELLASDPALATFVPTRPQGRAETASALVPAHRPPITAQRVSAPRPVASGGTVDDRPRRIYHDINTMGLELHEDGALDLLDFHDRKGAPRRSIFLKPEHALALMLFFAAPGVAQLIERAEIERQVQEAKRWEEIDREEQEIEQKREQERADAAS